MTHLIVEINGIRTSRDLDISVLNNSNNLIDFLHLDVVNANFYGA